MSVSLVIHTENGDKLKKIFQKIKKRPDCNSFNVYLHAKGYIPWADETLKEYILSFKSYYAFPTSKSINESIVELAIKARDERILILDENATYIDLSFWDEDNFSSLYFRQSNLLNLKLDTKYKTLKWFIIDLLSQKKDIQIDYTDNSEDNKRYLNKINYPLFKEKIIYVDGGLGDHIMALPLLEKLGKDIFISCKYQSVFEHLNVKGFIHWNDDLFGGYRRFVYEYGSTKDSKTIIDAFFEMYGYKRESTDILKYNGKKESNDDIVTNKKIAIICTSAAKVGGIDSHKNWVDIRWMKLVNELQKQNYFVVQVGSLTDVQIPTVDLKFLDRPIPNLAGLIDSSSVWITVDTFFHHFASSIKPEVGICLTPYYNDHAKHVGVTYIEKDCGKNFSARKWWLDSQQPERKECMDLIKLDDVLSVLPKTEIVETNTKRKLKILIASLQFNGLSGSELYVYELAKQMVKMGHDVTVIAEIMGGKLTQMAQQENIKVLSLHTPPGYINGDQPDNSHMLYRVGNLDYDIIHVQQNGPSEFITRLYPEIKKVATIHSEVVTFEVPIVHDSIYKYICIRPEIQNKLINHYNIDKDKTTIIYNPVDSTKFNKEGLTDKNYILFIGSLNYLRQQVTFDLIERAKQENKELWIVGFSKGSPYIDDILPYDHVKYFDETENVEDFIKGASYTVSILFGRTVIESFMCGKNCLVYNIDDNGGILSKEMCEPTSDIQQYSSDVITNKVLDVYYEILN